MKRGRVHLSGAQSWPDHFLAYGSHGVVFAAWRVALGFEFVIRRDAMWLNIYLVLWAFEIFFDVDGSYAGDATT